MGKSIALQTLAVVGILGVISPSAFGQANVPRTRLSAVVYGGHALKTGDGLGPFVDGENESGVNAGVALNIFAWHHTDANSNKPDPEAKAPRERSMIFDLSHPVPGSGAKRLVTTYDSLARFHVFWKHDHAETEKIDRMETVPVGITVETDRVEMWSIVDGVQHVLQMGPWAMGEFSPRAPVNGNGPTKAKITRASEDSWRILAPAGSIARLWDYSDIQNPIDKGLYYFDFDVKFTRLK